ncbi:hypothetical protein F4778DRAFT_757074 [Xylariomycetidae sp. FL2044]|nr:hypothetical protein F4778DRAFT_767514 [Xylariomycetidae sp. FL2044]KAH9887549.1 hypothetical protein F4778DRAFT_757074 [Xylariomycetidae sp. FL2044]
MASHDAEIRNLDRLVVTLVNRKLQHICATYGLRTSGVKAELQNRIRNALHENAHSDPANYQRIRKTIMDLSGVNQTASHPNMAPSSSPSATSSGYHHNHNTAKHYNSGSNSSSNAYRANTHTNQTGFAGSGNTGYRSGAHAPKDLEFKPSPFYTITMRIGSVRQCEVMNQHRNTIHIPIKASDHVELSSCVRDKSLRVMIFCAADNQGPQDITFPYQSELKVNGDDVKANLRGLKGKVGSTRPVDITDRLRLKQSYYSNTVEFTYALTNKTFYFAIYLCKMLSPDDLITDIKKRRIMRASVIQEMARQANDPDIVATSTVLSLKCPLSTARLKIPCRSTTCKHIQCFDAKSYLLLQEQGPQWVCPVCNKPASFESLAIDEYVKDILDNTSESLEQVTIEPDGQWRREGAETQSRKSRHSEVAAKIEDDDDLSILSDSRAFSNGPFNSSGYEGYGINTPDQFRLSAGTPNGGSSREPSSAARSGSNKRPAAEVIDLTLSSDDDDDEPIGRAPKRQYLGRGLSGLPDFAPPDPFSKF